MKGLPAACIWIITRIGGADNRAKLRVVDYLHADHFVQRLAFSFKIELIPISHESQVLEGEQRQDKHQTHRPEDYCKSLKTRDPFRSFSNSSRLRLYVAIKLQGGWIRPFIHETRMPK